MHCGGAVPSPVQASNHASLTVSPICLFVSRVSHPATRSRTRRYAGLVFVPLTQPYLHEYGEDWMNTAPRRLYDKAMHGMMQKPRQQIVILSQVGWWVGGAAGEVWGGFLGGGVCVHVGPANRLTLQTLPLFTTNTTNTLSTNTNTPTGPGGRREHRLPAVPDAAGAADAADGANQAQMRQGAGQGSGGRGSALTVNRVQGPTRGYLLPTALLLTQLNAYRSSTHATQRLPLLLLVPLHPLDLVGYRM